MKKRRFQLGYMTLRDFARIVKNKFELVIGIDDMPLTIVSSNNLTGLPEELLDYPIRSITPSALNEFIIWLEKPCYTI